MNQWVGRFQHSAFQRLGMPLLVGLPQAMHASEADACLAGSGAPPCKKRHSHQTHASHAADAGGPRGDPFQDAGPRPWHGPYGNRPGKDVEVDERSAAMKLPTVPRTA
eukprot:4726157-Prymnesium_polylepis.4